MFLLNEEAMANVPWTMIWGIFAAFWVVVLTCLFVFIPMMTKKKEGSHHGSS